jgi:butyrate kinase
MTATRAGSLPSKAVLDLAFGKGMTPASSLEVLLKKSGLQGYLGTASLPAARKKAASGDACAALVLQAMAYQVCKDLGAYAAVLDGGVDAVILTGGMAHHRPLVAAIRRQAGFLGKFMVFPGQVEMEAMAEGAWEVLSGKRTAQTYR